MAESSILQQLKKINYSVKDKNGNNRVTPIGYIKDRGLSTDRIEFLQNLLTFLFTTNFIHDETKLYISDETITIKVVHSRMMEALSETGVTRSEKTTANKIWNDQIKIERVFGSRLIEDVVFSSKPIDEYSQILVTQFRKVGNYDKLTNNIVLKIPKDEVYAEYTEDYDLFISAIKPYLKAQMLAVTEALPKKGIGYFNYLISNPTVTGDDRKRRLELMNILDPDRNSGVIH